MLIPKRFRREMQNLALVVEEEPNAELLAEMEIEPPESLYGLYQGIPLPERTEALRRVSHPGLVRDDHRPAPPQPRRPPTRQRRPLSSRHRPHAVPSADR